FGSRVLVNSGTSTYAPSPERQRQRGTAAHNTLRLDGEDSSEVWGSFRVARRARVSSYLFESAGNHAQAAHDGYRRLRGRPLHRRSVRVVDGRVEVQDIVERQTRMGPPNDVELIWHF